MKKSSDKRNSHFVLDYIKNNWHFMFLVILLVFFTIHTAFFISNDRSTIAGDSHTHLRFARDSYVSMWNKEHSEGIGYFDTHYSPFVYMITGIFFKLFGLSVSSALWSIYPFSVIFIIALFFTGLHFGGKSGAVATSLIGISNIYFINYSHLYMLDVPHLAFTSLAILFLFKSEMFKKPLYSYLFGVSLGIAILCRSNTVYFVFGPLVVLFIYFGFRSMRLFLLEIPFALGINSLLYYYLTFAYKNRQNVEIIRKQFSLNLILLFAVSLFLVFLTIVVKKKLMDFFQEKNIDIVNRILNGTRSLILSMIIFLPVYLYILPNLMFRLTDYIQKNLAGVGNFISNYYSLNNFFPMIFVLAGIGLIFILIRRKQVLDFIVLISYGISGFLITTYSIEPFGRYLIALVFFFSILGGYWIEYIGKLKFIVLAFIFSYSALSLGFIFFSPDVPEILCGKDFYKDREFFYLEPVCPTNPEPDRAKLFAITDDIKKEFDRSFRGRSEKASVYYKFSSRFTEVYYPDPPILEQHLKDTYGMKLYLTLKYKNIPLRQELYNIGLIEYMNMNPFVPLFLVVGYVDRDYPAEIMNKIQDETGREYKRISGYGVPGKRKVNVYIVYPLKEE